MVLSLSAYLRCCLRTSILMALSQVLVSLVLPIDVPDLVEVPLRPWNPLNLLLLRREKEARVVVEVLDAENADLARTTGADDFLVSDAISSRFITQLAQQPECRAVLLSLYAAASPSIHLVLAADLGLTGDMDPRRASRWLRLVDLVSGKDGIVTALFSGRLA
jgi:hypothetical protein